VTGALGKPAPDPGDKVATFGYAAWGAAGINVTDPSTWPSPNGSLTLVGEDKHGPLTLDVNAVGAASGPISTNSGTDLSRSATGGGTWQSDNQLHSISAEGYGYRFTGTTPAAGGAAGAAVSGWRRYRLQPPVHRSAERDDDLSRHQLQPGARTDLGRAGRVRARLQHRQHHGVPHPGPHHHQAPGLVVGGGQAEKAWPPVFYDTAEGCSASGSGSGADRRLSLLGHQTQ